MEISPIVRELLRKRDVCSEADVLEFLSQAPKLTYDPFLLKDMEEATDLIKAHLEKGSKICIYGDYDTDGITSVTLMLTALSKVTDKLSYYIPSRFGEGYGLNKDAVAKIKEAGADLIITVDCGSLSVEEVELAKSLGMDIIVTDHHTITDKQADCILLNPKRPDDSYPFDGLAGVGVAFKLVQALTRKGIIPKSVISEVIDLVAIGTIGDIMPLLGENRTIVKYGMKEIKKGNRAGLKALMNAAAISPEKLTSENIAFGIVPRLNAAGRMADASLGVKLLIDDDGLANSGISEGAKEKAPSKAELAIKLNRCNDNRKTLQEETFEACVKQIEEEMAASGKTEPDDAIILYAGKAHEGITGIVAGKLKDKYNRPTMIVTDIDEDGTMLKGTGRSIEGVNLYELLKTGEDLFVKFGGHKGACGFSLPAESLETLRERVLAEMKRLKDIDARLLEKKSCAEMTLGLRDVSLELARQLELLAPFGEGNPAPLFALEGLTLSDVRFVGDGTHAKFTASQPGSRYVQCMLFARAKECKELATGTGKVDIEAAVEENYFNGNTYLQLIVKEIKEHIDG